jgi:hypothetical protein
MLFKLQEPYEIPPSYWSVYNNTNQSIKNTRALRFNSNCPSNLFPIPAYVIKQELALHK